MSADLRRALVPFFFFHWSLPRSGPTKKTKQTK